jgi:hypothetical protein
MWKQGACDQAHAQDRSLWELIRCSKWLWIPMLMKLKNVSAQFWAYGPECITFLMYCVGKVIDARHVHGVNSDLTSNDVAGQKLVGFPCWLLIVDGVGTALLRQATAAAASI